MRRSRPISSTTYLAIAPAFDLCIYQSPSGGDVRDLLGAGSGTAADA